MFETLAERWNRFGAKAALQQGNESLTYSDLARVSAEYSALFQQSTSGRVAIMDRQDIASRARYLAAIQNGMTVVPVSASWPASRVDFVLNRANVDTLIDTQPQPLLTGWRWTADRVLPGSINRRDPTSQLGDSHRDAAYILFTSGSTGNPKGVPIPKRAMQAYCQSVIDQSLVSRADRVSGTFALTFDVSVFDLMIPAIVGATSIVPNSRAELLEVKEYIQKNNLSIWFSVPSVIDVADKLGSLVEGSFTSLRRSMFIGEQLSMRQALAWSRAAPLSEIQNVYGPTEATVACASYEITPGDLTNQASGPVPIGRPFGSTKFTIGSTRHDRELLISGPQVFNGYLDSFDDTHAFEESDGVRWYRSGDIVRQTDRGLEFESRIDRQIQRFGYRVELGEVEDAFLRAGASTAHALIVDGDLVVAIAGHDVGGETTKVAHARLPQYMWPTSVRIMDQLPTNQNGKVDVKLLASHFNDVRRRL
ncbi:MULTISPECIES: AMP-binding protein [unclassified Microbacterium]|uniref:AMP-binding protein n=1 Tax=unclassified Microbacterium TaxID=2609290 RepID=UPI0015E37A90|nr:MULTISPECIES: AMP-binding protein [unclassified Microbacterium]